jgi:CheY-like chemotaxis protein
LARKILLADDSVTAQNMGRKILADAGYEVITVNNGSAALKRISETKPDLIVLDVYMPGYSGLEVCQRLKESGDTSRIPIVLTVGKLEPFKPEEAKRVRADGFIVKPFEASELLSALSKLEDRIVPRPEPAKPGRFARANAALDEARDKSVATDADSGWKSRISFPSKKKSSEPEYADDPGVYNPVNKDLRTTVETKKPRPQEVQPESKPEVQAEAKPEVKLEVKPEIKKEDTRVDLGALAPEGLPKDVTPEEIAALAAAAAQVKGKLSESEAAPEAPATSKPAEAVAEAKVEEIKPGTSTQEDKTEAKAAPQIAVELAKEAASAVAEPISQPEKKDAEAPAELAPVAAISATAIAATTSSGIGVANESDMPVTMAVAAGAEHSPIVAPRWKAVPVAVLADEAALSLEEEMRKALSAVAAAEMAQPATPASAFESAPVAVAEIASPAATAAAEPISLGQPVAQPAAQSQAVTTMSALASVATDAISEAVKDLEAVAASFTELHKPAVESVAPQPETPAAVAASAGSTELEKTETPATTVAEPSIAESTIAKNEPVTVTAADALVEKVVEAKVDEKKAEENKIEEAKPAEVRPVEAKADIEKIEEVKASEAKAPESAIETQAITAKSVAPEIEEPVAAASVDAIAAESAADSAAKAAETSKIVAETASAFARELSDEPAKPAAAHKSVFGGIDEMAKKESEMAENTAAAWASWRRIRDDGKSGSSKDGSSKDAASKDGSAKDGSSKESSAKDSKVPAGEISVDDAKAAMAVAAGAEKAPEEASAGEDSEVSAIVDSVLADLRPKIVEEISRKLGKKK